MTGEIVRAEIEALRQQLEALAAQIEVVIRLVELLLNREDRRLLDDARWPRPELDEE